jgi:hypothetical protein
LPHLPFCPSLLPPPKAHPFFPLVKCIPIQTSLSHLKDWPIQQSYSVFDRQIN